MLRFINSNEYQIFIMGHSCGLFDKTLLNTLFEHEHCKSIKVFYRQIDSTNDNYMDVTMNMSRNFNDKKLMRSLVVPRENSVPLK